MIEWARPGQMVVCVNARFGPNDRSFMQKKGIPVPAEGCVYTIRGVRQGLKAKGTPALFLLLEELPHPIVPRRDGSACEPGYRADRFRPVKPTSIEQFERLLHPIPETNAQFADKIVDTVRARQAQRT